MTALDDAQQTLASAQATVARAQLVVDELAMQLPPPPPPSGGLGRFGRYGTSNGWRLTNPPSNGGRDAAGQDAEIGLCVELGAKIVRIGQGATAGQVIEKLLAKGITPHVLFGGNPTFPWGTSAASLANQAATMAGTYGDRLIYECLNEPTLHGWTADAYLPYLHAFHDAVKAKAPNALVLMAGLFSASLVSWVERFVAIGGLNYTDAYNGHLYDDSAEHGSWSQWDMTFGSGGLGFYDVRNVRSLMDAWTKANGKPAMPILSSESGGPWPKYSEAKQATIVRNALAAADGLGLGYRRTALTLIYNVYDDDVAGFGMVAPDKVTRRPSFAAYQAVAKA